MIDFSLLFSSYYLFDKTPSTDFIWGFAFLAFFGLMLFSGSILKSIWRKNKTLKKSMQKRFWHAPYLGLLGILLVFFRFGKLPVLSMRFILFLVLALSVFLLVYASIKSFRNYKRRLRGQKEGK